MCCQHSCRLSFFFSSRRRHTRSVSAFLLNRSSDLNFFSDKLVLTSVTPAFSAPVLQTPKATSSTLYFDSLTVNAGKQVPKKIGRAVQQECRDRSRMPSSA